jgi:hypothetical protein
MRCVKASAWLFGAMLATVTPISAQEPLGIDAITEDDCAGLFPDAGGLFAEIAPDLLDTAAFSLLLEAFTRQCAALGFVALDTTGTPDATRTTNSANLDDDDAVRLSREARYYLETAMQIDPDASNDLLRRLLGNGPRPAE